MIASTDNTMIRELKKLNQATRQAFTLIELLVVLAIISILMAIIVPAFQSVMENSREANTMSNMQQIQTALALYKLDNKKYPSVLFAYANTGTTCNARMDNIAQTAGCSSELVGLYPQYVKDWHVFTCSNNPVTDTSSTIKADINTFSTSPGTTLSKQTTYTFFKADVFDVSPQITGINQLSENRQGTSSTPYICRYQTSWTDYTAASSGSTTSTYDSTCFPSGVSDSTATGINGCAATSDPDYSRQLRWTLPPSNTYVTSLTTHVPNANKVLVLYLDGSVKKVSIQQSWLQPVSLSDYATLEKSYNDSAANIDPVADPDATAIGGAQVSGAGFWRITPDLKTTN